MNLLRKMMIFLIFSTIGFCNLTYFCNVTIAFEEYPLRNFFQINCNDFFEQEKLDIEISASLKSADDLNDLKIFVIFDKRLFKFMKKHFKHSDILKTEVKNLDNNKILKICFKNKNHNSFYKENNSALINLELDLKKKIPFYETDIKIIFESGDKRLEESKHIKILDKKQIENISVNTELENQIFEFKKDTVQYSLYVDSNKKEILFEVETKDKNIQKINKKLKKAGSTTHVKIGKYEFEIFRIEKKKSEQKSEKIKKEKKIKNKEQKTYSKNNKKSQHYTIENCEKLKKQDESENLKNQECENFLPIVSDESAIESDNNNPRKILILSIIVIAIVMVWIFLNKIKHKKNKY